MRYLLSLIFIQSMFMFPPARAEVYIVFDENTKEVISISPQDDCVIQPGMTKEIINERYKDFIIQVPNPADEYYWRNGRLVTNVSKQNEKEQAKIKMEEQITEARLIDEKIKSLAIQELKKENHEIKYHDDDGKLKEAN